MKCVIRRYHCFGTFSTIHSKYILYLIMCLQMQVMICHFVRIYTTNKIVECSLWRTAVVENKCVFVRVALFCETVACSKAFPKTKTQKQKLNKHSTRQIGTTLTIIIYTTCFLYQILQLPSRFLFFK